MRWRGGILAAVVCIAVLMLTFGLPTAAARGTSGPTTAGPADHTIVVLPNGHDDTADIQAAFNACVSYGAGCTVQLVKGTYYIAQIAVLGFEGSLVGAGQGRTILQALPNLPSPNPAYNTQTSPFWAALPGASNPWPILLTFVNGVIGISGMTITEPYANPVPGGWVQPTYPGVLFGTYTALSYAILVTGTSASAYVDHVTVIGAPGDAVGGYNVLLAIAYRGHLLPAGWTDPYLDQLNLTGTAWVTNSVVVDATYGFYFQNLLSSSVTFCSNTGLYVTATVAIIDVSSTRLLACSNYLTGTFAVAAIFALQSLIKPGLTPSTLYIENNELVANDGANDVTVLDFGVPATLSVVMDGNVLLTNSSCGCYPVGNPDYAAVVSDVASFVASYNILGANPSGAFYVVGGPAVVSHNVIVGSYAGVWVDYANHVTVTQNVIRNSAAWGIAVTDGSSYNLIAYNIVQNSGLYDLYWDGTGTGNVWTHNVCSTSSPPGLC